jgi:hypothetical protein
VCACVRVRVCVCACVRVFCVLGNDCILNNFKYQLKQLD